MNKPPTTIELTPNLLGAWLCDRPDDGIAGFAGDGNLCPLARLLRFICPHSHPFVGPRRYRDDSTHRTRRLPAWARRFVGYIDDLGYNRTGGAITVADARRLLLLVTAPEHMHEYEEDHESIPAHAGPLVSPAAGPSGDAGGDGGAVLGDVPLLSVWT